MGLRGMAFAIAAAMCACACTSYPIIADPRDAAGAPRGSVTPLAAYLQQPARQVKLILVHGVSDHCPGFALDERYGWLSARTLDALALSPRQAASGPDYIYDSEFIPHKKRDPDSRIAVMRRPLRYTAGGNAVDVEAIEITWSLLTQWVKTKQLGYDLTGPLDRPSDGSLDCLSPSQDTSAPPPPRAMANRLLKESVLDRSLVDAVLYGGSYGVSIQRGVAEALCRTLGGRVVAGHGCAWPAVSPAEASTRYVFVTHSLGSRIVYDTLIGLLGHRTNPTPVFDANERKAATPFIENMIANTTVIYMMANQLPMIGLSYASMYARSDEGPVPWRNVEPIDAPGDGERSVAVPCGTALSALAAARARLADKRATPTLDIVAFSDPNDLLSWSIPAWYLEQQDCVPDLRITNVFVGNGVVWAGAFEHPLTAHVGYFTNRMVWDVVRCGAKDGVLLAC